MVTLAPSILAADFGRLGEQVEEASAAPGVDRVHVDVMDGQFVPNISFGPLVVEAVRRHTHLPLDVHLMIEAPARFFDQFAAAGASGLTVHVETCPHLHRDVEAIHELGLTAGVAINPATPAAALDGILDYADLLLVMTVNPGFGGQGFIPGTLAKVAAVREALRRRGSAAELEVDGGIDGTTAPLVARAGATVLVAGSAVFRHPSGVALAVAELLAGIAGA